MARTALTADLLSAAGTAGTYVTPSVDGVSFRNTKKEILHVKNGSASPINVTVKIGKQVLGQSVTSPAEAIPAGEDQFFVAFDDAYEQPGTNDQIYVDLSAVTNVTVALLKLPF